MKWWVLVFILITSFSASGLSDPKVKVGSTYEYRGIDINYENVTGELPTQYNASYIFTFKITKIQDKQVFVTSNDTDTSFKTTCICEFFTIPDWNYWAGVLYNRETYCWDIIQENSTVTFDKNHLNFTIEYYGSLGANHGLYFYYSFTYNSLGVLVDRYQTIELTQPQDWAQSYYSHSEVHLLSEEGNGFRINFGFSPLYMIGLAIVVKWRGSKHRGF